jgi:hypothetical protein
MLINPRVDLRSLFTIGLFLFIQVVHGQSGKDELTAAIRDFHRSLVEKNTVAINRQTDNMLSYGHSNGWVETKTDLLKNLETGYLRYQSIREDSLQVEISDKLAHARFVGEFNVSLNNGNYVVYRLKVLEVWMKKGRKWILFARQAVKA